MVVPPDPEPTPIDPDPRPIGPAPPPVPASPLASGPDSDPYSDDTETARTVGGPPA